MYTLTNINTNIVQAVGVSEEEFSTGNYEDAGKGVVGRYLTDNLSGTPRAGSTKIVKHKEVVNLTWEEIREERDRLLTASDWRAMKDYPNEDQESWLEYRYKLRDIPQDYLEVADVVMPDKP